LVSLPNTVHHHSLLERNESIGEEDENMIPVDIKFLRWGPLEHCCICSHFRMWKPQESYCTVKKTSVEPLKENEPCWKLRKGFNFYPPQGIKHFGPPAEA
jgi:hypothetical protein